MTWRPIPVIFSPIFPIEPRVNDWYGTAWIDVETAQLLKLEAHSPDDHNRLEAMERHARGDTIDSWDYEIESVTTWFETEVGGLRFPSRVELRRVKHHLERGKKGWKIVPERVFRVDQSYRHYEFFGVSTKEQAGSVVGGEP